MRVIGASNVSPHALADFRPDFLLTQRLSPNLPPLRGHGDVGTATEGPSSACWQNIKFPRLTTKMRGGQLAVPHFLQEKKRARPPICITSDARHITVVAGS